MFKKIRNSYIPLFLISLMLYTSCDQYDSIGGEEQNILNENNELLYSRVGYDEKSYTDMMSELRTEIDNILMKSKPSGIELVDYKVKLINGEVSLNQRDMDKILESSEPLINYGTYIAQKNNVDIDINDPSSTIALGGLFSPTDDFTINYPIENPGYIYETNGGITWGEVGICVGVAIGADALWALGGSSASAWTVAAITRAFTAVAKRFLGPIGVAIAVVSFGVCIAEAAGD